MSKPIIALFVTVPFSVQAEPIFVEYEGSISFIEDPNCLCELEFAVGDPIAGVLTIDSDLAPPDLFDDDPHNSQHGVVNSYAGLPARSGIDFIFGGGVPGTFPNDVIRVADDVEVELDGAIAKRDVFMVVNSSLGETDRSRLVLEMSSLDLDLIAGDDIAQPFTADASADLRGTLELGLIGRTYRAFTLALSRITVTPGRCRAPG